MMAVPLRITATFVLPVKAPVPREFELCREENRYW